MWTAQVNEVSLLEISKFLGTTGPLRYTGTVQRPAHSKHEMADAICTRKESVKDQHFDYEVKISLRFLHIPMSYTFSTDASENTFCHPWLSSTLWARPCPPARTGGCPSLVLSTTCSVATGQRHLRWSTCSESTTLLDPCHTSSSSIPSLILSHL